MAIPKIIFGIEGKEISHFTQINLKQVINDHHKFTISVPYSVLEHSRSNNMETAQENLGKVVHIRLNDNNNFLGIITHVRYQNDLDDAVNQIIISGYSKTILLESGKKLHSREDQNLKEIVQEVIKVATGGELQHRIDPEFTSRIEYQTQYLESDFRYIQRLARQYNEWLFYDGEKLIMGKPKVMDAPLKLTYKKDLFNLDLSVQAKPNRYSGYTYSENIDRLYQAQTKNDRIEGLPDLGQAAFEASKKLYKTPSYQYGEFSTADDVYFESVLKKKQQSTAADGNYITATSRNPKLKIGSIIHIESQQRQDKFDNYLKKTDLNKVHYDTYSIGSFIITEIEHKATSIGEYENSFKALPSKIKKLPEPEVPMPTAQEQRAIVTDNGDPLGHGRIRVQLLWQKKLQQQTPWLYMLTPHAGTSDAVSKNRGWVSIPEAGDHVMVDFRYNDPDRPYVTGSIFNGKTGGGGKANNHMKSFATRSGCTLQMDDTEGSITIKDPSGNNWYMDGAGNIDIKAPKKITLNATDIDLNASNTIQANAANNLEINVSNHMIMNVMTQLFVFTPALKQVVSGFMSLFSGKALINSTNVINIEAKQLTTQGSEKMLVHSDKLTTINSREVAEMHGATKNSFTNKAKKVKENKPEVITKAIALFRTIEDDDYAGEFGFDWLRQKDNSLTLEPDYESIIITGYKDGRTNLTKEEAIIQLKQEYKTIPIFKKGVETDEPYYVPYLTLFSQKYVDSITDPDSIKPVYKAKLRVLVEIEEDLDRLEFEYDKAIFSIEKPILQDKIKTTGLVRATDNTIELTCKKDLTSDLEIKLYAYPKGLSQAEQLTQRTLAGKILVLKNDKTARKTEKFVLTRVKTKITKTSSGVETGYFTTEEKAWLCRTLHQALVVPDFGSKIYDIDLSEDPNFQIRTINGEKHYGTHINELSERIDPQIETANFYAHLQRLCFKAKFKRTAVFHKKSSYFTIFSFGTHENINGAGRIQDVGIKNLILFPDRNKIVMAHEALHGLGLYHTHLDERDKIKETNRKYVYFDASVPGYSDKATDNIMSYNKNLRKSTWHWQWRIIRENV